MKKYLKLDEYESKIVEIALDEDNTFEDLLVSSIGEVTYQVTEIRDDILAFMDEEGAVHDDIPVHNLLYKGERIGDVYFVGNIIFASALNGEVGPLNEEQQAFIGSLTIEYLGFTQHVIKHT